LLVRAIAPFVALGSTVFEVPLRRARPALNASKIVSESDMVGMRKGERATRQPYWLYTRAHKYSQKERPTLIYEIRCLRLTLIMSLSGGLDDIPGWDSAAAKEPADLVGDAIKKEKLLRCVRAVSQTERCLTGAQQGNSSLPGRLEELVLISTSSLNG